MDRHEPLGQPCTGFGSERRGEIRCSRDPRPSVASWLSVQPDPHPGGGGGGGGPGPNRAAPPDGQRAVGETER